MAYDPAVIRAITRIGRRRGEPNRYITGELATGLVESGLQNLPGGDADSYGFRQQRASIYGRQSLNKQVNNLYDELHQYDKGQPLGQLIADVQRPAAQYRDRYGKVLDQARALLSGRNIPQTSSGFVGPTTPDSATPAAPTQNIFDTLAQLNAGRAQTDTHAAQLQRGWELLSNLQRMKEGDAQTPALGSGVGMEQVSYNGGKGGLLGSIVTQANKIDKAKVPYLWGGGHQPNQVPSSAKVAPLDCSGAVSRVLGVNPMVSGQFAKWGNPGRGKNVTIYANDNHVLMEINGHFWGTSASNPGGGAGWIPSSAISPEYLKGFKARHPPGL